MALQEAPDSIDITDIQFKVHSKYQLFNSNASTPNFNGINLLATASTFGLVIVGKPSSLEFQVLRLKDVVDNKESAAVPVRSVNLPGEPYILALSCDHTMLSVCYSANGRSFMDIYAVQSFISSNLACILSKVPVSNADGVKVNEILWNPVITNTMAMCLSDGTLAVYTIKSNSFEYNSLDKSEMARCACWSPKGKQIVVAFPNGKLAQYKPDLKLAKTIPCTVQLYPGPYTPIGVQWLSTYQFAVVFVEDRGDAIQSLFIVNAPKTAPATYLNYYDITYSQSGPRAPQVFIIHILQWNLLLMASSNSTEIGVLGTTESGETPLWKQYIFIDEGRAELPLTADKQDTFPIGLALETGCTHQLTIGENQIPVMPMLHILSTHGLLLSFNLLNLQPSRVDICSPPQNITDQSGLNHFRQIKIEAETPPAIEQNASAQRPQSIAPKMASANDFQQNLTFSISETAATSTPAKLPQMQNKPTFGMPTANTQPAKPAMTSLFGGSGQSFGGAPFGGATFGSSPFGLGGSKEPPEPFSAQPPAAIAQSNVINVPKASTEAAKPFLTVPPSFKPTPQSEKSTSSGIVSNSENDALLRKLIQEEIDAFDEEIRTALGKSKNVQINICGKDELSKLIKSIDEMQEITTQATESTESIKSDVQSLRLTLYEMLAMSAEAQSRVEDYKKIGKSTDESLAVNQTHRRLVNKLQNLLAQNQSRFDIFNKQLDANWNAHLQNKRDNDKARMRIPTLENVYQTLEKQHHILMKEKEKIQKLKAKVGVRDASPTKIKYSYSNTDNLKVNSLIDSVLSLTIGDQVKNERKLLNAKKLESLRKFTLASRQVNFIKPSRPDRRGLNSEIIIEKKLANAKAQKEKENLRKAEAELQRAKQEELTRQRELAKPKPLLTVAQPAQAVTPTQPKLGDHVDKSANVKAPAPAVSSTNTPTKSIFNAAQPPMSFVTMPEKSAPVTAPPIGFGSGIKSEAPKFGLSPSSGFSFGTPTKSSTGFGLAPQLEFDSPSLAKPAAVTTPPGSKPPLLVTPTSLNEKPKLFSPSAPKPTTPAASTLIPSSTKPKQNVPAPLTLSPATTSAATNPSPFKFDLGNAFSMAAEKSNKEEEKSSAQASAPIAKSPAISSFSFSLGAPNPEVSSSKPAVSPMLKISSASPLVAALVSSGTATAPAPTLTSAAKPASSIGFSFAKASAESSLFGGNTSTTSAVTTTTTATVSSSTDPSNVSPGFNICKPNVADSTNANKGLFGSFGSLGVSASPSTRAASVFSSASAQSPTAATSATSTIFGAKPVTTSATTTGSTNIFGGASSDSSAAVQQTSNIFGSKSADGSALSFASFGISAAPASSAASPPAGNVFATAAAKPTQSIFGGTATSNAAAASPSLFGGAAPVSPSNSFGASPFGGATTTTTPTNLFGGRSATTPTNNASSPSSASLFGGTASPASSTSLFGGSTAFSAAQPSTTGSVFGGSPFGGGNGFAQTSNATTPAPAAFGSSFTQATPNAPAFGAASPFGSSPFGQANQPAQSGFGSPQQQQQQQQQQQGGGFGLSALAANANPTFGSGPTFGTGTTFGSPKGFGTFTSASTSFQSPQKNTLFESLGSSENAMTFGNLAQAQNTPATPKPFSGGSSFSSWR